jgi:hypothetical protein
VAQVSLKDRFASISFASQLHLAGLAIVLVAVALHTVFSGVRGLQQMLLVAASLLFAAGFVVWCSPTLQRYRSNPAARAVVIIIHLLVLLLSAAIARNVVALALGLPPQDFDLTVSALALLFYIPVWALVVSLAVGTAAMALYLYAILGGFFRKDKSHAPRFLAQALGALAICIYSAQAFQYSSDHQATLYPLARWFALFADYQQMQRYPGVQPSEHVRLHENGVVSYAKVVNGEVVIGIREHK